MSNKYNILIVEDENNIRSFMSTVLKANGFGVIGARDGGEALMMVTSYCPDLVILDLGLPDMDGREIISAVREWSRVPIIVVSARSHEHDKVEALDLGADDYIAKPFGTPELLARIRTALRHVGCMETGASSQPTLFSSGGMTVDFIKRQVTVDGMQVHLTQTEYNIVSLLAKYSGRVLTYDYLIKDIWGPNAASDNQILRVNMANIRRKIEKNPGEPEYIFTEMGVGYRMAESE